ncbi:hypothetical protein PHLCEN_2v13078 [Hermanssonia centrifuga]|uniref:Peptidase A1 domain-containing protein n=1 Tax=Hermanssonia centrifuga TaxID=98765 RepID=A0A2R6NF67_9APHY|nr:hypothetical protein PHLCEN_2v13078 [Hermanssonia centrifuga]
MVLIEQYATNITLGGKGDPSMSFLASSLVPDLSYTEFPIQLDTGSSDVWAQPPFPLDLTNTTDIQANLTFGIGEVTGNIAFANMTFGPYEVPNQAFLNVTQATDFDAISSNGIFGILGLSFDIGSTVFIETLLNFGVNDTQGLTFLSNIFLQNQSAPNLFTVLLGRAYDQDGPEEGAFTIGEYVDGFEAVANEPKLFRTPAQTVNITDTPRWSVQMDSMTVNGKQFQFNKTVVAEADPGKQVVVLDTGFTFSQIPPAAVDFIYSSIDGAMFNQTSGLWQVPCECTTNLSFEFGNMSIPIHPLDITTVASNGNETICNNAYRAIDLPPGAVTGFDFIMGDSFLKNVYASFDYGDFTPDNRTAGVPFVQMLPTTNLTLAQQEFKTVRESQVMKNQNSLTVGSLSVGVPPNEGPFGILNKHSKRSRVVIYNTMPPMHHRVAGCMHRLTQAYGPVVVALLAGTIGLLAVMCIVGVVLAIQTLVRRRRGSHPEGYEPVQLKEEDIIFDESHYTTATVAYHDSS